MNREQMIAWLMLEGWEPCEEWDGIVHRYQQRLLIGCNDNTSAEGAYHSSYAIGSWATISDAHVKAHYEAISSQVP